MKPGRSVKYHNRVAKKYDAIYDDAYWRFHDEVTWRAIRPYLPRDAAARCLDLGCGTGKWGLKLHKSGFATTLVDHAPAMIGQVREKLAAGQATRCDAIVADIVSMPLVPGDTFALTLAMGDPLSICDDPRRAACEMFRVAAPGGIVIATADNKLAALDHYLEANDLDGLEQFCRTSRTRWLTDSESERFELHTFTPARLTKLFERSGFEVLDLIGKTVLDVRRHRNLLDDPAAMRRLVEMEIELSSDPTTAARAAHLQIVARKPPAPA
jgi:ubiquinone/menaquinone biosynthesis C-methylase UbiE